MLRTILTAALAFSVAPAFANDSVAELGTGGLILSRSDAVAMESEDLFISPEKVTVDYVFRNNTDKDVSAIVAFPMPDIEGDPNEMPAIPEAQSDNFLGFEVTIDGVDAKPQLEQKAFALGIDITAELKAHDVPLYPFGDAAKAALAKLPKDVAEDWEDRGIIIEDTADNGSGMQTAYAPFWQLRSTYWWRSTFPANKASPCLAPPQAERRRHVVGQLLLRRQVPGAVRHLQDPLLHGRRVRERCAQGSEGKFRRLSQIFREPHRLHPDHRRQLASGSIANFKLTIDKGSPKNLVSFCGDNVRKVGPTTFEMTAKDFYPEHDIGILLLEPSDNSGNGG